MYKNLASSIVLRAVGIMLMFLVVIGGVHLFDQTPPIAIAADSAEDLMGELGGLVDPDRATQGSIVFTKLPDPAVLPPGSALAVEFSHDSTYLAVGVTHLTANQPFLVIYKRDGDTFTKLPDPSQPSGIVGSLAFSYDSTYLAVGHGGSSPFISVYKRSGDTFTKLADPDVALPLSVIDVAFTSDASYLFVGHNNDPYLTIYKRTGDTFTKHNGVVGKPGGNGQGVAINPTDTYLVVGYFGFNPPYLAIFKREGETFTMQPHPADQPPGPVGSVAFSPDGTHLVLAHQPGNDLPGGILIYAWDDGSLTRLAGPDVPPPSSGREVAYSPDGAYLAVSHTSGARVSVYERNGDTYTKLPNPDVPPPGAIGFSVTFNHDTTYMVLGHNVEPNITIYKIGPAPLSVYLPLIVK